jgi:NAD(P)-dependent dehydrogenase (short-subunit alcohol dehydrogenase family)
MPTALVTGGASMLGKAAAAALIRDRWRVVLTDIDPAVQDVGSLLGAGVADTVLLDVGRRDAVDDAIESIVSRHGSIDGLVNVAGGFRGLGLSMRPFVTTTPAEWGRILQPNVLGVFHLCHAVLPHMMRTGQGSIVSISASRGLRGGAEASVYSAAKAAVIVFSQSLAQEVGRFGIRVNTIAPGNAEARWKTGELGKVVTSPLGRDTSAADVGDAVAFLMSDRAAHITGTCLDVSGGVALH